MERTPRYGDGDNTLWFKIALSAEAGGGGNPLLPPGNVTATGVATTQIDLAWTDPNVDETGYRVDRSFAALGPYTTLATLGPDVTAYQDTTVLEGETWYYVITALRGAEEAAAAAVSGTALTFTPPQLANLKQWIKANAIPGAVEGVGVETWPDQTVNGNDFEQANLLSRPVYFEAVQNNLPGVLFDGTTFMLRNVIATDTVMTLFVVLKFQTSGAGAVMTPYKNGNIGGFAFLRTAAGAREILLRSVADCIDGNVTTNAEVWVGRTTAAPLTSLRVNGVAEAVTNSGSAPNAPDFGTQLGHFNGGTFPMVGYIFEVLYYNLALSDADRLLVENYLIAKYAL